MASFRHPERFILLEPSCDIHLAMEGLPAAKRAVALRVFAGVPDAVASLFALQDVMVDPEFDFFPLDQAIVRFDNATRSLTPLTPGTVHMQVRYLDPVTPDLYFYVVARIQVHKKINGWWFGNTSLSVFKDNGMAHSQPSIYALFDKDEPGGGVVADITAHNYVDLTVDNPAICRLDTSFPDGKFRDRLRGLSEGETRLRGALMGQNRDIPVNVVNLRNLQIDPLRPVLKRENLFNAAVPRAERHNILFLAEGFSGSDENNVPFTEQTDPFRQAVTKASHIMFDSSRHQPYPLLKDGFNLWSHRETSRESGLTIGPELSVDGIPIPPKLTPVIPPGVTVPANLQPYDLDKLMRLVGLPAHADTGRTAAELKEIWNQAVSIPKTLGFIPDLAFDNVIEGWKRMIPRGIPQAIDSFYGMILGRRRGERDSAAQPRVEMVSTPAAGDPQRNDKIKILGQRMFEWYAPDELTHIILLDPRRYAPEYRTLSTKQFGLDVLISHIVKFADGSAAAQSPDHNVGKLWDMLTRPDPAAQSRQINSAGLVCMLVHCEHDGAAANPNAMVRVSIGPNRLVKSNFTSNDPNIRPLSLERKVKPKYSKVADFLAHEFGHCFNLGDEYERNRVPVNGDTEKKDNLTFVSTIQVPPPAAGHDPNFPIPIDPGKIKWATLHRIAIADMLVHKSTINGSQIVARLLNVSTDAERTKWEPIRAKWQQVKDQQVKDPAKKVFLRKFKPVNGDPKQLPVNPDELYSDLTIDAVNADGTVTLSGRANPVEFPAGSVLYMPKRDKANNLLTMVEPPVLEYMSTTRWKSGDNAFPVGVALTENHNKNVTGRADAASDEKDSPPDIPNYKKPCSSYKVLGLYEGGGAFAINTYRPAGACKMRNQDASDGEGEFCFLCKYLIVNSVDPGKHPVLDERFYPRKKRWWR
jgi:hypothetical protein